MRQNAGSQTKVEQLPKTEALRKSPHYREMCARVLTFKCLDGEYPRTHSGLKQ